MKKTVLSAAQATGAIHLGNYLGAILNWVKMQDDYNCFFFLADLHAITKQDGEIGLRESILQTLALYLAAGLSPDQVTIFAQSSVKEHAELAWILNCVTPLGWLKRMTQFKDKAGPNQDNSCLGLLSYPVLMAADILLYQANIVPVGDDQKQHLELTRDIAGLINRKFNKEVFKVPEPLIQGGATRIMSLKDGRKKMSKSDASDSSRINLKDSPDQIRQKIKKAKTDDYREISYDKDNRPEISNFITIYHVLSNERIETIAERYSAAGCAKFKNDLTDLIITHLRPIHEKYLDLIQNEDYLLSILSLGATKARNVAKKTADEVKSLFGFIEVG